MNVVVQILIGYFLADFIGGILHWFEDTYLPYNTTIPILSYIAKDNEAHHYFTRAITAYSIIESMILTLPIAIIIISCVYSMNPKIFMKYIYLWVTFFFFGGMSNNIHKLSHMRDCEKSAFIIQLQRLGVLCSSDEHREHHVTGRNKYCVNTNYLNWVLDNIGFWRGIEYGIEYFLNVKPHFTKYDDFTDVHLRFHMMNDFECPVKPSKADVAVMKEFLKYKYTK
jgi:plasmanylethanolamine desaturase